MSIAQQYVAFVKAGVSDTAVNAGRINLEPVQHGCSRQQFFLTKSDHNLRIHRFGHGLVQGFNGNNLNPWRDRLKARQAVRLVHPDHNFFRSAPAGQLT